MKRTAESQLTKDAREEEDDVENVDSGFKKADPSALAERKIRGLPKRAGAASASATPPDTTPSGSTQPSSRFSGFGGFGVTETQQASSSSPLDLSQPQVPPSTQSTSDSGINALSTSDIGSDKIDAARKYFLALHGLNKSFIRSVTEAVAADPFTDMIEFLGKYKSFRESIQKEFDAISSNSASETVGSASSSASTSASKAAFSMPTPPSSFSFGLQPHVTSGETPSTGLKPTLASSDKSTTPFSFEVKTTAAPSDGSKPASTGSTSAPDKPLAISFSQDKPTNAPFVFGESTANSSDDKVDQTKESTSSSAMTGTTAPETSAVPITTKSTNTSENPLSVFAKPSASTGSASPLSPSQSGFGFGTAKPPGASPFGSSGNGSIGNPVGFAFASPPTTPQTAQPPTLVATTTSNPSDSTEADTLKENPLPQVNPYDADGPGEENESTVYQTKCSANRFTLVDDKKKYVKAGTGFLKLKKHKDTGKMRFLMRNSSTGNIILNFNLHPGFNIKVDKKDITFLVPEEGEDATIYRLRFATEADAAKWPTVIQEE